MWNSPDSQCLFRTVSSLASRTVSARTRWQLSPLNWMDVDGLRRYGVQRTLLYFYREKIIQFLFCFILFMSLYSSSSSSCFFFGDMINSMLHAVWVCMASTYSMWVFSLSLSLQHNECLIITLFWERLTSEYVALIVRACMCECLIFIRCMCVVARLCTHFIMNSWFMRNEKIYDI